MANPWTMKGKEGREWPQLMGLSQHAMAAWWLPISWHTPAPHAKQSPPINTQYQAKIFLSDPGKPGVRSLGPDVCPSLHDVFETY